MQNFKVFISENVNEKFKEINTYLNSKGYFHNNSGGGSNSNTKTYYYTKSHNVENDDHLYGISVKLDGKKWKFAAQHKISNGYWGSNYYDPPIHRIVDKKDVNTYRQAVSFLDKKFKENVKKHKAWIKARHKKIKNAG